MQSKRLQVATNMPMRIVELFVKQYGLVKFGFTNDLEGMWMKETYCIKFFIFLMYCLMSRHTQRYSTMKYVILMNGENVIVLICLGGCIQYFYNYVINVFEYESAIEGNKVCELHCCDNWRVA